MPETSVLIIATGVTLVVGVLAIYSLLVPSQGLLTLSLQVLYPIAYGTIIAIVLGLSLTIWGLTNYLTSGGISRGGRIASAISRALKDKLSSRILLTSSLCYAVLFALISGTLVVRLNSNFSQTYGARVPSTVAVVCCGSAGQLPQLVIYVTQQIAFLLVPFNLIMLCLVSWLVGMNTAVATYAYKNRPRSSARWLTGMGAVFGLFTACPSCAGLFLLTSIGLTGTVSATLATGSYQALFILVSLPVLIVTLLISSRWIDAAQCSTNVASKNGTGELNKRP